MRAVPNGDCFIISVGAHLLPHVTKPQVTRWAASVRKRLRLPPTYLGEPERDLVCAYLRCRVGVVHVPMAVDSATGRRYPGAVAIGNGMAMPVSEWDNLTIAAAV
jgi:hypothetical protein